MSNELRVLAGPPVIRVEDPNPHVGRWYEIGGRSPQQHRERSGVYPGQTALMDNLGFASGITGRERILSDEECWAVYKRVPDVRASIEQIVRLVSTWDHVVVPDPDMPSDDPMFDKVAAECDRVRDFLASPNTDGEVWQTWLSKYVRDLLVFDLPAAERVFDRSGRLQELVVLAGGTTKPIVNQKGKLIAWEQRVPGKSVLMAPDQVVSVSLFPDSAQPYGNPLIETIVVEVSTMLLARKFTLSAFNADEHPPGLLVIAGLAGAAAERTVDGLRNMKGSDSHLRVVTTNNPGGISAQWVEFRRTPKDLEMREILKEIQRTIWRVFGVKPVSQGDTEATPRATAEVQLDAESSGLIEPILELLQAVINQQVIPFLVDDPVLAKLVQFAFDYTRALEPAEAQAQATADATDFDRGAVTVNEIRATRGRPPVEYGDTPLVRSGVGYVTLASIVEADAIAAAALGPDAGPGGGDPEDQGDQGEDQGEDQGDQGAAQESKRPARKGSVQRRSSDLPSDWPSARKFRGRRTLRLDALARSISTYRSDVTPLYRRAKLDVVSAFSSVIRDGTFTAEDAATIAREVSSSIERLGTQWDLASAPHYRAAALNGRDAATHWTGVQVAEDWRNRASAYHLRAMGYLRQSGGLISDLHVALNSILAAGVRGSGLHQVAVQRGLVDDNADVAVETILQAVIASFERYEHRIDNWTGKLVDLANEVFVSGMSEGASVPAEDGATSEPTEWWAKWEAVGDGAMCDDCAYEGSAGFRPLAAMPLRPGGGVRCGSRCRCVLTLWTKAEVDSGEAVSLD